MGDPFLLHRGLIPCSPARVACHLPSLMIVAWDAASACNLIFLLELLCGHRNSPAWRTLQPPIERPPSIIFGLVSRVVAFLPILTHLHHHPPTLFPYSSSLTHSYLKAYTLASYSCARQIFLITHCHHLFWEDRSPATTGTNNLRFPPTSCDPSPRPSLFGLPFSSIWTRHSHLRSKRVSLVSLSISPQYPVNDLLSAFLGSVYPTIRHRMNHTCALWSRKTIPRPTFSQ
jgi:hypothetical protein